MGGLLKHLQAKWQQVADQLGGSLQLHLTGSIAQQEGCSLSWTAANIPSTLTVWHCLLLGCKSECLYKQAVTKAATVFCIALHILHCTLAW